VPRELVIRQLKLRLPRNKGMKRGLWVVLSGFAREVMAIMEKIGCIFMNAKGFLQ